ncbi:hypothetical protein JK364_52065 [Streptomyces sp. 110]|uniref:Uncharacterized protein n=1 Tax=Streptomyces endocoffeicus TaxID=2898945 RepID=A0ABS1Q7T9_9ACTN|nr:hypothetical protein [Streptomyces endocoffeicus]MBL1120741.1 hypothetical protein [Streptomyces endocoffeicus]
MVRPPASCPHHHGRALPDTVIRRAGSRASDAGWHLYPVPLPRPADDYRRYDVEITELCVRRALSDEEHAQAEHRLRALLQPHVAAIRAASQ